MPESVTGEKMKRENPAAVESKRRMMEALLDLMQIKQIDDITVSEITENAEVARKTFYRHFASKENILDEYWDNVCQDIKTKINESGNEVEILQAIRIILHSCYENREFLFALCRSDLQGFLLKKWNLALPELHEFFMDRIHHFPQTENQLELDYLLTFNVGGVFNIVMKWIDDGMEQSPDELADTIEKVVNQNIK